MTELMCECSDEEVSAMTHTFIEYMSLSTGCQLSKYTIYQLKDAKTWIDKILNNQMRFDEDF